MEVGRGRFWLRLIAVPFVTCPTRNVLGFPPPIGGIKPSTSIATSLLRVILSMFFCREEDEPRLAQLFDHIIKYDTVSILLPFLYKK